jgi:uncharacterized protein
MTTDGRKPTGSLTAARDATRLGADAEASPRGAGGPRAARRPARTDPERAPARGPLRRHVLLVYALLAYGISWPLLVGGFLLTDAGALDPDGGIIWAVNQIAAAGPMLAAVIVVAVSRGRAGLAALGRSLVRWRVHPGWYALALLGAPVLMVAGVAAFYEPGVLAALPQNGSLLLVLLVNILGIAVLTGLAEEPGWRGYAQPAANRRYQPLVAALVVSVVWALWHLPNALFGQTPIETATHLLLTVVNGFVLAWVYNATRGSVLLVMLMHGSQNATSGLVGGLLVGSDAGFTRVDYQLLSAGLFGVLVLVVALRTRGRLGLPPSVDLPDRAAAPRP